MNTPIPGFEDVDWQKMFIEMLLALPCLAASILLWWKVLKHRDKEKIIIERLSVKKLATMFKPKNIKENIINWWKNLSYWKWITGIAGILIYILVGIVVKGNADSYALIGLGLFLIIMFLFGIYSTEDVENTLLMAVAGLLGSRHGQFFTGFNVFYPFCSFIIAIILFVPGELRKRAIEKKNKLTKTEETITHDRMVYYLSTGFFITSILYFLTSF